MSKAIELQPVTWERMIRAVEKVRERLLRATAALEQAGIPYAVVGDCAVAAWIESVDESAVRNTRNIELLIEPRDLDKVAQLGLNHFYSANIHRYRDAQITRRKDVVKIYLAGATTTISGCGWRLPPLSEATRSISKYYACLALDPLVRMQLAFNQTNNKVNCRDMIDIGLIDKSWPARFDPILGGRLQELLDNPEH